MMEIYDIIIDDHFYGIIVNVLWGGIKYARFAFVINFGVFLYSVRVY